jgi:hypothetical protein
MASDGTGTEPHHADGVDVAMVGEGEGVEYRNLWARAVAVLGVVGVLLALAESDPLAVVIMLGCCYGVLVLALVGLANCNTDEPTVDWPPVRWRAALGACLCVGFPAACAVSPSATVRLALVLALSSPPLVERVCRFADRSRRWADSPDHAPRPRGRLGGTSPDEQVTRLLERGPTPGLVASMDDATLCVAWQRSFAMLSAASTVTERALVAHLRQLYLDELDRRHPHSLASWLRTLPAASSGPDQFLPDAWL